MQWTSINQVTEWARRRNARREHGDHMTHMPGEFLENIGISAELGNEEDDVIERVARACARIRTQDAQRKWRNRNG